MIAIIARGQVQAVFAIGYEVGEEERFEVWEAALNAPSTKSPAQSHVRHAGINLLFILF